MDNPQFCSLHGRSAFISGGTSGINLAIAHEFVRLGVNTLVFGRDAQRAEAAAQSLNSIGGGKAIGGVADVRDATAVDNLFSATAAEIGKPSIVIAGAAGNFLCNAADLSPNGFKTVVDIDLLGTFNVFKASYRYIQKPGSVLLAISAPQAIIPTKGQAHACASKAGINMLVKCLALEWGTEGIRVNAISPGPIEGTEGTERLAPTREDKNNWATRLALGRLGTLDEIVSAVRFMVEPASSYMTGAILDFDGGHQLGPANVG